MMDTSFAILLGAWGAITATLALFAVGFKAQLRDAKKALAIYEAVNQRALVAAFTNEQVAYLKDMIRETIQSTMYMPSKVPN